MIEFPPGLIVEGVAVAIERWLVAHPGLATDIVTTVAELRAEVMTPAEAAAMLGVTVKTLRANHAEYGIDKSVALGPNEPRYFRSQVVEALHRIKIKGRSPQRETANIAEFPQTQSISARRSVRAS